MRFWQGLMSAKVGHNVARLCVGHTVLQCAAAAVLAVFNEVGVMGVDSAGALQAP